MSENALLLNNNPVTPERLQALRMAAGTGPLLILTHDNPDPDGLASGAALSALFDRAWGISCRLRYSGLVARAENKAMLNLLTPEWECLEELVCLKEYSALALVDTQPGAGNDSLPAGVMPQIVFDHHLPVQKGLEAVAYLDIRSEIGATVSMVYQHLEAAEVEIDSQLATAILYGIQADTQALSRGGWPEDQQIYFKLLSRFDRSLLAQVEQAGLPREDFQAFNQGLKASSIFGKVIISYLGALHRPDFLAELADMLIRLEHIQVVLCLGYYADTMYLSLRTSVSELDAGLLIQKTLSHIGKAGGHGMVAGGQVSLIGQCADIVAAKVQRNFLEQMNESGIGEPLLRQT